MKNFREISGVKPLPRLRYLFKYWLPVGAYALVLYIQSALPTLRGLPDWPGLDKAFHLAAYAVLGMLLLRAFYSLPRQKSVGLAVFLSIALSSLYGVSDEIHQHFNPGRQAEGLDVLADACGSAVGAWVYHALAAKQVLK